MMGFSDPYTDCTWLHFQVNMGMFITGCNFPSLVAWSKNHMFYARYLPPCRTTNGGSSDERQQGRQGKCHVEHHDQAIPGVQLQGSARRDTVVKHDSYLEDKYQQDPATHPKMDTHYC